ncbi:MAG: hypothetical protein IJY87_04760 [Bacilli bacterium]|nr:hypothetical protein [Bacilli bacterium]
MSDLDFLNSIVDDLNCTVSRYDDDYVLLGDNYENFEKALFRIILNDDLDVTLLTQNIFVDNAYRIYFKFRYSFIKLD